MCGIAGTIYRKKYHAGIEIRVDELERVLHGVQEGNSTVEDLLELCWLYKSNINFLRYFIDENERKKVKELSKQILAISNSWLEIISKIDKRNTPEYFNIKYKEYESILDCHWFLAKEIPKLKEMVNFFENDQKALKKESSIIFYKSLATVINAIDNRLEFRGRDSLGISIQLCMNNFNNNVFENYVSPDMREQFYYEKNGNTGILTFIFKTANVIGSLGDNARSLKDLIKKNVTLKKAINNTKCESGSIVIHTRWASVGEVNISNCHPITNAQNGKDIKTPLILTSMNGDIYNYKEVIASCSKNNYKNYDKECTTDCLAFPAALTENESLDLNLVSKTINGFSGSFTAAIQGSSKPGSVILCCNGKQGLYIGISNDSIMFASDVYGLIESCRYFYPVKSGSIFSISNNYPIYSDDIELRMKQLNNDKTYFIRKNELKTTNITTRDIDKGEYNHFLEKEIRETKDIILRTILGYLQTSKVKNIKDLIVINDKQVPSKIIDKFKKYQFQKVIITGMGTCYTAAAAIAMYMRHILRNYFSHIQIEPHIATEASAFYLKPNMEDTLVIVIAQSGTTIDTNVYVQMAKERGASALAIANKREGDVTFLVDGTLYIGSGRDIEIAVPSTKTYTAQVILGYILTLYISSQLTESNSKNLTRLKKNIDLIREVPKKIDETFKIIDKQYDLRKLTEISCYYSSWYIIHDDSPNSVCAMEARIKYSEGCYHTLPYMHIDQLLKFKIKKSFLTFMTNQSLDKIESKIKNLLDLNNYIIIISDDKATSKSLKKYEQQGKLFFINIPASDKYFSFLPTIIINQVLSYYTALALDQRKKYFKNMQDNLNKNFSLFEQSWSTLVNKIKEGVFNEGFSVLQLSELNKAITKYKDSDGRIDSNEGKYLSGLLNDLHSFTKRPIDTIKHQAKTITVGAVRENNLEVETYQTDKNKEYLQLDLKRKSKNSELSSFLNSVNNFSRTELFSELNKYKEVFIYIDGVFDLYGNFILDFLNNINYKYSLGINFRLAKYYEYSLAKNSNEEYWIFITNRKSKKTDKLLNEIDHKRILHFNLSNDYNDLNNTIGITNQFESCLPDHLLNCFYIVNVLIKGFSTHSIHHWNNYIAKNLNQLDSAFEYLKYSNQFKIELNDAANVFLSKKNWKCIGSGINYNTAKFASNKLISTFKRACAFDVLENHKHVDISAEGAILTFIANIWRQGYQSDIKPELNKLISHNNVPIIVTNIGDQRFDNMRMTINYSFRYSIERIVPIIRLPKLEEIYTFPLNVLLVNMFIDEIKTILTEKDHNYLNNIALSEPSDLEF